MEKYFVKAHGLSSITLLDEAKEDKEILELNKKFINIQVINFIVYYGIKK